MRSAVLGLLLFAGSTMGSEVRAAPQPAPSVVAFAKAWLTMLMPAQRGRANLPWNSPNRRHWGYRPFTRRGLALREMTRDQRVSAHALLRHALTAHGYAEVQGVIARERILRSQLNPLQRATDWRDPGLYWLAVFGTPKRDANARWGWRLGGHHLSINLTYQGEKLVSATPWFIGGSPAQTRTDHVTRAEEDLGRQLFESLEGGRKRAATWPRLPGDIEMQRGRPVLDAAGLWGVPGSVLSASQKDILRKLVLAHGAGVKPTLVRLEDVDAVRFAWRGQGRSQYYRIVGQDFAIEYRNLDNHMHSVWRSPTLDFGGK